MRFIKIKSALRASFVKFDSGINNVDVFDDIIIVLIVIIREFGLLGIRCDHRFLCFLVDLLLNDFILLVQIVWLCGPLKDIHVEVAFEYGSIGLQHLTCTVLATSTPLTLVNGSIRPIHLSITITLIVLVVAFVHVS